MAKKAKAKRQKAQPSVLGSLPSQRPDRIGGRRARATTAAAAPPEAGAAKPAETRARPRAASEKPRRAARAQSPAAATESREAATPPRPRRPAPPPPPRPTRRGPPRGTELVTTAIQAAGELAQIGLTAGGRAVKRAVDRIPRP
jgi:hypothetical protein